MNKQMLQLAREAKGLTQGELATSAGVSQALISKAEHGLADLPEHVLAKISELLEVPADFFSRNEEIVGAGLVDFFHRKRLTLPAKPLRQAHAFANFIRLESGRLLASVDIKPKLAFPVFPIGEHESPATVAQLVRSTWRTPSGPIANLLELVEATGTPVFVQDLGHHKLAALSMPGLTSSPVIVVNSKLSASDRRWSLAHELGHLVMHDRPDDHCEEEADLFAGELLAPANEFGPQTRNLRFSQLGALKAYWRISMFAIVRRTDYLKTNIGFDASSLYRQINASKGIGRPEPGEFEPEVPTLVKRVIESLQKDAGYSIGEVATVMGCADDRVRTLYLGETKALRLVSSPRPTLATIDLSRS